MSGKTTPPAGADPSMEDILASIRKILNEDEPQPELPPAAEPEDEVLELEPSMMVQPPPEPEPLAQVTSPPPAPPESTAAPDPFEETERLPPVGAPPVLVGPEAAALAASSVDGMLRTLAAGRASRVYHGGPTIEDLVREEIRPLLKEWLDTHLPPVVERLVQAEIERVVGRVVP